MIEATKLIAEEEGYRQFPYTCTAGKITIGHGFNIEDVGISEEESLLLLEFRINKVVGRLKDTYVWFHRLSEKRQAVIISMAYQLGLTGFSKFKRMIRALERNDWGEAAKEAKDSRAYRQTKNRWDRQIQILLEG